jgi:O-succinylbenzoate synthase
MKIEKIVAREISMRLKAPFETSFGVTHVRRIILIELQTDEAIGWGEVTAGEGPFYNPETTDTAWMVIRDFLVPLLLGKSFESPSELVQLMAPVRGHEMAKAALECAAWDALAQARGVPLSTLLGGTQTVLPSGVSLGIHHDIGALVERIALELESGYRRIKLKIKPGKDVAVVEAVRRAYPEIDLTVDANSAYSLRDIPTLRQLDAFGLKYIEQPLAWNEIYEHAAVQKELKTAICLDECIHTLGDAHAAIELGACRVINIKLGRVSGHTEANKIQDYCREKGIPVWCGGMLEAGIGRAHNIAMSSLPGFVMPGDVSASKRYWEEDIVEPEITVSAQGTISVPTTPGIGFAVKRDYIEKLSVRSQEFSAKAEASSYSVATA